MSLTGLTVRYKSSGITLYLSSKFEKGILRDDNGVLPNGLSLLTWHWIVCGIAVSVTTISIIFFQYINGLNLHKKHTKAWWLQAGLPPRHVTHAQCNCYPISSNLIQIHELKFCNSVWVHVGFCGRNFFFFCSHTKGCKRIYSFTMMPWWYMENGGRWENGKEEEVFWWLKRMSYVLNN